MKILYKNLFLKQFCIGIVMIALGVPAGCGDPTDEFIKETEVESAETEADLPVEEAAAEIREDSRIYVDIEGAVLSPGVYEMTDGDRVYDLVEAAGGFLPEAYTRAVNQAAVLSDEQQIVIPTTEEYEGGEEILTAGMDASVSGKININTADLSALCTLTGIGEAKAASIIAYREAHGGFGTVEELMQVEGIKEGTYNKIKDDITT